MNQSSNDKKDFIFVDRSTRTPDLHEIKAFSNATYARNKDIGFPDNAQDKDIREKISSIAAIGEYKTYVILTSDKGRDGDTTFTTPYDNITIIYSKDLEKNIKKWGINNLESTTGYYCRLLGDKVEKVKKEKYGSRLLKFIKKYKKK